MDSTLNGLLISELPSVDFTFCKQIPSVSGVYIVCAEEDKPIYIGSSSNLRNRFSPHNKHQTMEDFGALKVCYLQLPLSFCLEIEKFLIFRLQPALNEESHRLNYVSDSYRRSKAASSEVDESRFNYVLGLDNELKIYKSQVLRTQVFKVAPNHSWAAYRASAGVGQRLRYLTLREAFLLTMSISLHRSGYRNVTKELVYTKADKLIEASPDQADYIKLQIELSKKNNLL